jgi:hypothetical protein
MVWYASGGGYVVDGVAAGASAPPISLIASRDRAVTSVELAASGSDGSVEQITVPVPAHTSTVFSLVHDWWTDQVFPLVKLLGELLAAGVLVSVAASALADVGAGSWTRFLPRPRHLRLVGYVVFALGTLRLLSDQADWPSGILQHTQVDVFRSDAAGDVSLSLVGLAALLLVILAVSVLVWSTTGSQARSVFSRAYLDRRIWDGIAVMLLLGALALTFWPTSPGDLSSLGADWIGASLVVLGGLLITWQAAFTASVAPARDMKDTKNVLDGYMSASGAIGDGTSSRVTHLAGSDQQTQPVETFAALASGGWAKVAATAVNLVVPTAGFRLLVNSADEGDEIRIEASLRRGRYDLDAIRFLTSDFDHDDTGAPGPTPERVAALAIAAWVHMTVFTNTKQQAWGHYGTTSWRSLALAMVALDYDDAGAVEHARVLYQRALAEDPKSLAAIYSEIATRDWLSRPTPGSPPADPQAGEALSQDIEQLTEDLAQLYPRSPLHLRSLYLSAATDLRRGCPTSEQSARNLIIETDALLAAAYVPGLAVFPSVTDGQVIRDFVARFSGPVLELAACILPTCTGLLDYNDPARRAGVGAPPHHRWSTLASQALIATLHDLATLILPYRVGHSPPTNHVGAAATMLLRAADLDSTESLYRRACRKVYAGDFVGASQEVRRAASAPHLASWALRDAALADLWGLFPRRPESAVTPAGEPCPEPTHFLELLARLEDLGMTTIASAPAEFQSAGMDQNLSASLRWLGGITSFADLTVALTQHRDALAAAIGNPMTQRLSDQLSLWRLAACPAIGPKWARILDDVGLGSADSLVNADPRRAQASVAAYVFAQGDTGTPRAPTAREVFGWQLSVAGLGGRENGKILQHTLADHWRYWWRGLSRGE